jgi:hypothetical protein
VGIAEQHAVTFAAGLACEGLKPVVAIYSTFLQRAYDQLIHDVAIQNLPVVFALDRAGLVGADGATHAGAYDIQFHGSSFHPQARGHRRRAGRGRCARRPRPGRSALAPRLELPQVAGHHLRQRREVRRHRQGSSRAASSTCPCTRPAS